MKGTIPNCEDCIYNKKIDLTNNEKKLIEIYSLCNSQVITSFDGCIDIKLDVVIQMLKIYEYPDIKEGIKIIKIVWKHFYDLAKQEQEKEKQLNKKTKTNRSAT